jgi:IMP dehydrogenase
MKFKEAVTYDDMLLVPQYSDIKSRSEVNIGSTLKGVEYQLPIMSSPMDTVSEGEMLVAMNKAGGLGVLHRYNTIDEQLRLANEAFARGVSDFAVAVGVTGDYLERAQALVDTGVKTLCLDVAHGHHILMKDALTTLRKKFGNKITIIAGNVCTLEGVNDLADWGADAVRAPYRHRSWSSGSSDHF